MRAESPARCIVVGYDGSPASRAAIARAAERVVDREQTRELAGAPS